MRHSQLPATLLAVLGALAISHQAFALSVVSDPWPAADPQPTHCIWQHTDNLTPPASTVEVASVVVGAAGSVSCRMNVDSLTPGAHTLSVWAKNATLTSTKQNFALTLPQPPLAPPVNIRCDPVCQVVL